MILVNKALLCHICIKTFSKFQKFATRGRSVNRLISVYIVFTWSRISFIIWIFLITHLYNTKRIVLVTFLLLAWLAKPSIKHTKQALQVNKTITNTSCLIILKFLLITFNKLALYFCNWFLKGVFYAPFWAAGEVSMWCFSTSKQWIISRRN